MWIAVNFVWEQKVFLIILNYDYHFFFFFFNVLYDLL